MDLPRTVSTERGLWLAGACLPDEALSARFDELMLEARRARELAYAPYSKFRVGAAVLMEGEILSGCNVENASYGATLCAERVAVAAGVARGLRRISVVAVTTGATFGTPLEERSPCGLCRQVVAEFADDGAVVLIDGGNGPSGELRGEVCVFDELFPLSFRLER